MSETIQNKAAQSEALVKEVTAVTLPEPANEIAPSGAAAGV